MKQQLLPREFSTALDVEQSTASAVALPGSYHCAPFVVHVGWPLHVSEYHCLEESFLVAPSVSHFPGKKMVNIEKW